MITRQMTPFFSSTLELSPFVYFIFAFQDFQNSVPFGRPHSLYYFLVCKIYIDMPKMTLSILLT